MTTCVRVHALSISVPLDAPRDQFLAAHSPHLILRYQACMDAASGPCLVSSAVSSLTWAPPPPDSDAADIDAYVHTARSTAAKPGRATEAALAHLQQCAYSVAQACADPDDAAFATEPWTEAEIVQFEHGLSCVGKAFGNLQQAYVPSRTVRHIAALMVAVARLHRLCGVARRATLADPSLTRDVAIAYT